MLYMGPRYRRWMHCQEAHCLACTCAKPYPVQYALTIFLCMLCMVCVLHSGNVRRRRKLRHGGRQSSRHSGKRRKRKHASELFGGEVGSQVCRFSSCTVLFSPFHSLVIHYSKHSKRTSCTVSSEARPLCCNNSGPAPLPVSSVFAAGAHGNCWTVALASCTIVLQWHQSWQHWCLCDHCI